MSQRPLILVADDDDADRKIIADALKKAGYNVMQAIDAGSARKVANEYDVAFAFIDHFMTPHDGVEFARYMALDEKKIPMYLVTHEDDSDLLKVVLDLGFLGLMKKPVDPKRAVSTVERILSRYERT
ncbi:MAG: response regulator [Pseudobdellovibrionaceae bacterium]|jgi:two-component system phosphate regulon response regulator PhoB|nr:response regulator [Pseudobdellovibrionaceae bacterium]